MVLAPILGGKHAYGDLTCLLLGLGENAKDWLSLGLEACPCSIVVRGTWTLLSKEGSLLSGESFPLGESTFSFA